MSDRFPRVLIAYGLALAIIAALGAAWLDRGAGPPRAEDAPAPLDLQAPAEARLTVHVAGAVRRPGVYRMRAGSRVDDAVSRAGGSTRRADLAQINLAAKLEDGRQVLVPARATAGAAGTPAAAPAVPLNLNTATLEQLDELDGIGPATAQQILDHRDAQGGFGSVDELAQVPGIGPKRLAGLRERVRV